MISWVLQLRISKLNQVLKSKVQHGAGWWFNDTKRGMLRQMSSLADQGLLMHFVGMLTDSRSFISYSRHDYFRRILSSFIGDLVEKVKSLMMINY